MFTLDISIQGTILVVIFIVLFSYIVLIIFILQCVVCKGLFRERCFLCVVIRLKNKGDVGYATPITAQRHITKSVKYHKNLTYRLSGIVSQS